MNLVWFRSDLRVLDNSALWNAINSDELIACFLIPIKQWKSYGLGERKIQFVRESAEELKEKLASIGISLLIEEVGRFSSQEQKLKEICQDYNVKHIYWNNEYPLDERNRDQRVQDSLACMGVQIHRSDDNLILPPGSVRTLNGDMYKVYTPFKKAWISQVHGQPIDLISAEVEQKNFRGSSKSADYNEIGIYSGEQAALKAIDLFIEPRVSSYKDMRDIPSESGTSKISAHLSAGTISPRALLKRALDHNQGELNSGDEGIACWISELVWREFYFHLIYSKDSLSKNQPFKPETNNIGWNNSDADFNRWCDGLTGVPIVDAGMRQLNQTGWMHNRVRMIAAMYLTKNLFVDWRKGERYFLDKLVDADFALNNGGWQWSASTGTDAVPYFRVFNPFSQAARFDSDAKYIKKYVHELVDIPAKILHDEKKLSMQKPEFYPAPVVDTRSSRSAAIDAFRSLA